MTTIDELVYLLEAAFSGAGSAETDESQALLVNLSSVDEQMWRALPAGGARSVESIVLHVGACTIMYDEYAFGVGALTWDEQSWLPWSEGDAPMAATIAWLQECTGVSSITCGRSATTTWRSSGRRTGASAARPAG